MHAVVVDVTFDHEQTREELAGVQDNVVPMVKNQEGFVAGYWLEPHDGRGHSVVLFDREEQATAAAPPVGMSPMEGVTFASVVVLEVIANG